MKNFCLPFASIMICILSIPLSVHAEGEEGTEGAGNPAVTFVCEAEIFYTWKRVPPPPKEGEEPRQAKPKEYEVFYTRVGEEGADQEDVKNRLTKRIAGAQGQAMTQCQSVREKKAACVAGQLKKVSSEYRMLDFAARRAMLDTITESCSQESGLCVSTRASEIGCFENKPPELVIKKEAEGGGEEGDKKGKKKK